MTVPRILIAEDNLINQKVLQALIDTSAFAMTIAENGEEVVALYKAESFDIVLMDISMPLMDGMQATALIRAFELETGKDRTPIIALTAHAMAGDRERFIEAGMDDYLSKPLDKQSLANVLEKWVPDTQAPSSDRIAI